MSEHLPPVFASLGNFHAPVVHYKVCSTFDSSPRHGSIGRAIELGIEAFSPYFVPIVVGSPHLRRFVFEGRLFASAPDGGIHRIDRHPMSRHPVTPMREPDLRRHLQKQTKLRIGHIAHTQLHTSKSASKSLEKELAADSGAVLFDTIDSQSLAVAADLIWQSAVEQPLFCAASSGLTAGLISVWRKRDLIAGEGAASAVHSASPLLVISGSCSVATSRQIDWASRNGFETLHADPSQIVDDVQGAAYQESLIHLLAERLNRGQDTVLYTARAGSRSEIAGEALGIALGVMLRRLLTTTCIERVVLCGGDTSSHAVQQLGISALTWKASLQPGAPLCQAHFSDSNSRSLELVLKGGQVGSDDFFAIAKGSAARTTSPGSGAVQASLKP